MKKRIFAALLAFCCSLLLLTGCGSSGKTDSTPKDYAQILHDARSDEDNEYNMIFSPDKNGGFTARDGYSSQYEADALNDEIQNMLLPLLDLPEGSYTDFAASISAMMVQSYGVAIVKSAEGRTQDVVDALDAYILGQQQSMEHYLEDQYQIAAAAKVKTVPTGEVVMVCCENSDAVLASIKAALAA